MISKICYNLNMKFYSRKTAKSRESFAKAIFARDIHCRAYLNNELCHRQPLDPHHICGRSSRIDDDPRNGIALCRMHHDQVTAGKLKVQASWLTQDQIVWIEKRKWKGYEKIEWERNSMS
jgi:hypothetical protein